MDSSLRLFSVRGIAIKVHVTFPLILVWAAFQFALISDSNVEGAAFGVIVTLLLFTIVVLHELGHSFMALRFDVPIRQIVLLPIGGVAQMSHIPEEPRQEFLVAVAGPFVNLALAIVLTAAGLLFGLAVNQAEILRVLRNLGQLTPESVFYYVFATNIFIGVFNLLPAFPMDGGRVLRALLASRIEYARATSVAVLIGQAMAWIMGLAGFLQGDFFLILIAIFIYIGASQEGRMSELRRVLTGLKVAQAYSRQARTLSPGDSLQDAVQMTLSSFQASFPVCEADKLVGMITQKRLLERLQSHGPDSSVEQAMIRDVEPVSPQDGLYKVQQKLAKGHLDALPVTDDGRFVGLITLQDINEIYQLASSQASLSNLSR